MIWVVSFTKMRLDHTYMFKSFMIWVAYFTKMRLDHAWGSKNCKNNSNRVTMLNSPTSPRVSHPHPWPWPWVLWFQSKLGQWWNLIRSLKKKKKKCTRGSYVWRTWFRLSPFLCSKQLWSFVGYFQFQKGQYCMGRCLLPTRESRRVRWRGVF